MLFHISTLRAGAGHPTVILDHLIQSFCSQEFSEEAGACAGKYVNVTPVIGTESEDSEEKPLL